ncbi:hypothetical protein M409DRAFT_31252 [Zasmidium cellare ATCC 36951]|uniref:DUF4219 domain-containing protein n=1 Tax=Zasmidium cellare ATCC 36951 TaxID=1080233 RepID=A0A6A6BU36_ZASCE|nr:uncharacterized protein M409DRAFT_31252 [Zasmidium cellare ATCC 36951]KAF2158281.1 hypothetical protein M409DRAFT_31252 [Zasmidium cellare ATCC 36951]
MGSDNNNKIPLLKGRSNYKAWAALVKKSAIGEDWWKYIDPNDAYSKRPSSDDPTWIQKQILKKDYGSEGVGHRMEVFERWDSLTLGTDVEEFCRQYREVLGELKMLDMKVDNEVLIYSFIARVSQQYSTWAKIQRNDLAKRTTESLPAIDDIIHSLLEDDKAEDAAKVAHTVRRGGVDHSNRRRGDARGRGGYGGAGRGGRARSH